MDQLPSAFLSDLQAVFQDCSDADLRIDAELSRRFAEGLQDVLEAVMALEAFWRAHGLVHMAETSGRSQPERRALAAASVALDPDGRVVAFPVAPRPSCYGFSDGRDGGAA